jgi:hypothetical protein
MLEAGTPQASNHLVSCPMHAASPLLIVESPTSARLSRLSAKSQKNIVEAIPGTVKPKPFNFGLMLLSI